MEQMRANANYRRYGGSPGTSIVIRNPKFRNLDTSKLNFSILEELKAQIVSGIPAAVVLRGRDRCWFWPPRGLGGFVSLSLLALRLVLVLSAPRLLWLRWS